jgi:hypothetical protein
MQITPPSTRRQEEKMKASQRKKSIWQILYAWRWILAAAIFVLMIAVTTYIDPVPPGGFIDGQADFSDVPTHF